jgi:hypothetical protein
MNGRNIVMGGIAAGFLLLILMVINGFLVNLVMPSDLSQYGGMRAMNDPIMNLFYLYPFVIAFAAAVVFDTVYRCLAGTQREKGLRFGALLFCIMTVPSLYVMVTSMTWPADFISAPASGRSFPSRWWECCL